MLSELWLPHVACFLDVTYGLLFLTMGFQQQMRHVASVGVRAFLGK